MNYETIAAEAPESLTQDRWGQGVDHHPMSLALMKFVADHDFKDYKDYFCWKTGGDGDNGESLMYQMDPFFEWLDKQKAKENANATYERDGEVAVVYRPSYGIGWSSHDSRDQKKNVFLAMNGQLARLVEAKDWPAVETLVKSRYPDMYLGTLEYLRIYWMPKGTTFEITEHDGNERIEIKGQDYFHAA